MPEIAVECRVNRLTVYDAINRWKTTLESLLRPGRPEKLTRHQMRLLIRIIPSPGDVLLSLLR